MKIVKAKKWGNSLAVRLPKEIVARFDMEDGSEIVLEIDHVKGVVSLVPAKKAALYLKKLLAGINKDNLHSETDWGKPRGREIW